MTDPVLPSDPATTVIPAEPIIHAEVGTGDIQPGATPMLIVCKFPDPLICEKMDNDLWKVHARFRYIRQRDGKEETITVRKGATTDFASVPPLFWSIVPKDGRWDGPALIHDELYRMRGADRNPARTRAECDFIFYEGMGVVGVPYWKRWTMWTAVRLFGSGPWNKGGLKQ